VPQADNQAPEKPQAERTPKSMLDRHVHARMVDKEAADTRAGAIEAIWNLVWWRRIAYFATLAATLLLLGLPLLFDRLPRPPFLSDGRTWIGGVIRLLTVILPSFVGRWVDVYADNPFYFLLVSGLILLLLTFGNSIERRLRDEARRVWRNALEGTDSAPPPSRLQTFRNGRLYQRFAQRFKWYFLPDWIVAPVTVAAFIWIASAAFTQMALPFLENGTLLCQPSPTAVPAISRVARDFFTADVCSKSFGLVLDRHRYVVTFEVGDEAWYDADLPASPQGVSAGQFPWGLGYLAAPFKRVIDAHYLQPLLEIRPTNDRHLIGGNIQIYPLSVRQVGNSRTQFRADFTAAREGELFLFVNDAMLPLTNPRWGRYDYRYFYKHSGRGKERGNRGTACVTVEWADAEEGPFPVAPANSICERVASRIAQRTTSIQGQSPR
jgi:hypothetical protein